MRRFTQFGRDPDTLPELLPLPSKLTLSSVKGSSGNSRSLSRCDGWFRCVRLSLWRAFPRDIQPPSWPSWERA